MKIKDTKLLRKLYKEKVRGYIDSNRNENFVGHSFTLNNNTIYGFFEIYHGDKPDIGKFIAPFLDMAQDWQAVYELIQNASDSESSYFGLFFDDNYLMAINNGKQFSFEGVRSILNIAQSPKDSKSNIGKFGVGFKIVHKLLGKSNGKNELLNHEGPIIFSWNSFNDLKDLANLKSIVEIETNDFELDKIKNTYECSNDSSWLFKILLTNFPCGVNDKIYDLNFLERSDIISEYEINKLSEYINKYVFDSDNLNKDDLKSGSIIFLKLGTDKYKQIKQSHIANGIDYSLNILNTIYDHSSKGIKKILINENGFVPGNINVEIFRIFPEDKEYEIITSDLLETEKPDYAELLFGYPKNVNDVTLKSNPNIYLYFPLSDEQHNFNFLVHCNTFHNLSQRTNLGDSEVNCQILQLLSKKIKSLLEESKKNNFEKFINIYSCLLNSNKSDKQNKLWVNTCIYDVLLDYIKQNIPSSQNTFFLKDKIRIKKFELSITTPLDFGINSYQWFYYTDNDQLMKEASDSKKLNISSCTIFDLIKDTSDIESANNWLINNIKQIELLLDELNKDSKFHKINRNLSYTDNNKFINNLRKLKFLIFDNNEIYSIEEIVENNKLLICYESVFQLSTILSSLGFSLTISNFSNYGKLFEFISSDIRYLKDKSKLFDIIAKETFNNKLSKDEKEKLFNNFKDLNSGLLSNWLLFKNEINEIKPLNSLISVNCDVPEWLCQHKIHPLEYFKVLDKYLIQENSIYSKILKTNWDQIISNESVKENPCNLYEQVINYYEQDKDKIVLSRDLIMSIKKDFKPVEDIYFHRSLININNYDSLSKLIESKTNLLLPYQQILTFLDKKPFDIREKSLIDVLIYPVYLTEIELRELIIFLNLSKEEIFSKVVIKNDIINNEYIINQKSDYNFQYYSDNNNDSLSKFIEKNHKDKYIELPSVIEKLIQNKNNLLTEREILDLILKENHEPKDIFELFINSDSEDMKVEFLNYIASITIKESLIYEKESFEFNVFKLVLKYLSDDEEKLKIFRDKIIVENNKGEKRELTEVAYNNKVNFKFNDTTESYDLELAKILPSYEDKSGLMESIINNFKGFNEYDLKYKIFKAGSSMRNEEILAKLSFDLENSHQLAFLILMLRLKKEKVPDLSNFSYHSKAGLKNFILNHNYYINNYAFINEEFLLTDDYGDLKFLLKLNDEKLFFINNDITIALKPFFQDQTFNCFPFIINLYVDPKSQKELFHFLFEEYCKQSDKVEVIKFKETSYLSINKQAIYNDDNKINFFGFNPAESVFPSEFALTEENLPEWVNEWIEKGKSSLKLKFLKALGLKDEESDLLELRKFLVNKINIIDENIIDNLSSGSSKYISRTIDWLLLKKVKYKALSTQLKCLIKLLNIYEKRDTFPIVLIDSVINNKIEDYEFCTFDESNVNSYWLIKNNIIEDLNLFGNDFLMNIFNIIKKKNQYLINVDLFEKTYLEKFPINFLEYKLLLDSEYLLKNSKELDKPYYQIWKNELSGKFQIHILLSYSEINSLQYSVIFQNEKVQSVILNKVDIDVDGNIFMFGEENIDECLKEILGKNGFEQNHLDLLLEKKQFEPEEIAKYYEDILSEPKLESFQYLEKQISPYFTDDENIDFEEKLIKLLNIILSPWGNNYIYHFTHIENAVAIINNNKILSRNSANTLGFSDAASSEQIYRTRSSVHNFARFYFRPLTPTQWHNEGLGRNRYQDNPKCPIPIFFKINITDVLKKNAGKCYVSNGNLSSDWAKTGNTYEFLKNFDFLNLYSRFGEDNFKTASQQEFIVNDQLDLSDINFEIICRTVQDKEALNNLLEDSSDINIIVDDGFYFKDNPFINHLRNDNCIKIGISNPGSNNYKVKFESKQKLNVNKIEGNFTQLINDKGTSIKLILNQYFPSISLDFINTQDYSIYFIDEFNDKWLIFSTNKLVNLNRKPNSELINSIISIDVNLKQYFNSQVRHYTLFDHTILVLNEFDKYFDKSTLKGIMSKKSFKKFLTIHDIGKPSAHIDSSKENQYVYSIRIFDDLKDKLELNEKEINIFYSMLNGDPLGLYFQNKFNINETINYFTNLCQKYNIPIKDLFYLYTIYYQVDAGSYTADAGGKKFLEKIFEYKNGLKNYNNIRERLTFSVDYEEKYNLLSNKINQNGN